MTGMNFWDDTFLNSPPSPRIKSGAGFNPSPQRGAGQSLSLLSLSSLKIPGWGVWSVSLIVAGVIFFGTVKDVGAAPGDLIGRYILSYSKNVTGVSYGLNNNVSWISDNGYIYQGSDNEGTLQTIVSSVSDGAEWKFLAEQDISGTKHFGTLNDTIDNIYIINSETGAVLANWAYPGANPDYISGIDFNENGNVWVYNRAGFVKKIEEYSLGGNHISTIEFPFATIAGDGGIKFNSNDGSILMNEQDI